MRNQLIYFCSIILILIFTNCSKELPNINGSSVPVSLRATIPDDAIEIADTTTTINFQQGGNYVIRGTVTTSMLSGALNSNNKVTIYVEGKWLITQNATALPEYVSVIVTDGGEVEYTGIQLTIASNAALYVEKGGIYLSRAGSGVLELAAPNGNSATQPFLFNNGTVNIKTLRVGGGLTINNTNGIMQVCTFIPATTSQGGQFFNYGTFIKDIC